MTHTTKRSVVYVLGHRNGDTSAIVSALINNNNNNHSNNNNNHSNNNNNHSNNDNGDGGDDKNCGSIPSSNFTENDRVPSPSSSSSSTVSSSFASALSSSSLSPSSSQSGAIVIHEWKPSSQQYTSPTRNNKEQDDPGNEDVALQVWEFNGTMAHQHVQSVTMGGQASCVVVLLLGMHDQQAGVSHNGTTTTTTTTTHLHDVLHGLQAKCPGCYVIVTLVQDTHSTTATTNTNTNNDDDDDNGKNSNNNNNNNNNDNKEVTRRLEEIQSAITEWTKQWTQSVEKEILDIECDLQIAITKDAITQAENEKDAMPTLKEIAHKHTDHLRTHVTHLLHIHDTVLTVNTSDVQGVSELQTAVIQKATSRDLFPHLTTRGVQEEMSKIIHDIEDLKDAGSIMMPLADLDDVIQQRSEGKEKSEDKKTETYQQLQELGVILLLAQTPLKDPYEVKDTGKRPSTHFAPHINQAPTQFVCVNPEAFVNMILGCLIEEDKKTYKLEATRFWPRESGFKPPDPDLLARVLETLPHEGCIREAVLPILWQDYANDQSQIVNVLRCLQTLGVLVFYEKSVQDCAGLAMPHYPLLSAQNTHASVLMDMIPRKRPQLNWTSTPFKDDLQITWRMLGVTCLPPSSVRRCLARIKTVFDPLCDYLHVWDEGVLIKFYDATICVEFVKRGNSVHTSCRVNEDDADGWEKTVQSLWVHLATVVKVQMDFLSWQLPGIVFQTKISIFGAAFFATTRPESELEISLVKCLTSRRFGGSVTLFEGMMERRVNLGVLFPFEDDSAWTPRDWIDLVLAKSRQLGIAVSNYQSRDFRKCKNKARQLHHKMSLRRNKGVEVKWKTNVVESEAQGNNNSTRTASVNTNAITNAGSDNDVISKSTTSGDARIPSAACRASLTKEEWRKKASELACQFVSCTLAMAVADFVALKSGNLQGQRNEAQVVAARLTADAARAVHQGDLEAAAIAVIEAVHAVDGHYGKGRKGKQVTSQHGGGHQSRLCAIL